ncbi:hypothetical protein KR054_011124 [Drosophila jambulina]|nr:hypothetical protein KR054_011124 [Drosophila jambulina]
MCSKLFTAVQCTLPEEELGLAEHNRLRALHGVNPLILDSLLSDDARVFAKFLAGKQSLENSKSDGLYSENVCLRSSNPEECVQNWYDEIFYYDFSNPKFSFKTGDFTNLIWASVTELGWGEAQDANGVYYVVARYFPAGNVQGQFEQNVPPVKRRNTALGKIAVSLNAMIISIFFGMLT